jgi:hypothetical protein
MEILQRDILWSYAPYPCIGEFKFLTLNLPSHPQFQHVLSRLSNPQTESTQNSLPIEFLDLGCCVAQELRFLAYSGVPSSQLYGSDINAHFLNTSYALFNDKDSFRGSLVPADIFDSGVFKKAWTGWEGKFGIVHAALFLHLFGWKQQLSVCKTVVKMMSEEPGAMFLGKMVGCEGGGERGGGTVWRAKKYYLYDEKTFGKLWGEVAKTTGTRWKVEADFQKMPNKTTGNSSGGGAFFAGERIGWLTFSVERI